MINQMFQIAGDNNSDDKNLDLQFLSRVNFDEIEKLDPNGREGFVTICQVAVPTDIELDEKHDQGFDRTMSTLTYKVLAQDNGMSPKHVKVEISSEEDVEFYYKCIIDFSMYDTIKCANSLADNV